MTGLGWGWPWGCAHCEPFSLPGFFTGLLTFLGRRKWHEPNAWEVSLDKSLGTLYGWQPSGWWGQDLASTGAGSTASWFHPSPLPQKCENVSA